MKRKIKEYRLIKKRGDFPGGPVTSTLLPMPGARVPSLVRDLDSKCCN